MKEIKHLPYKVDERSNRHHFYERLWKHRALELLTRHTEVRGLDVLDYGCGRGEALELFGARGAKVLGVDPDPICVSLASKFGRAELLNGNDPLAEFYPGDFDVVIALHVLEHVENPKETLTALGRLSRKFILVAVPNLRKLGALFKRSVDLDTINSGHLQGWDHWHFRNLAERHCGLEIVDWIADATILPGLSQFVVRTFGNRAAIRLETGLFRCWFPFHCISVIALMQPMKRI
jgi:2-polyprenyl-3-methyl-5-hydroxy-6-metoxy-1,4-benzoquinol methylase